MAGSLQFGSMVAKVQGDEMIAVTGKTERDSCQGSPSSRQEWRRSPGDEGLNDARHECSRAADPGGTAGHFVLRLTYLRSGMTIGSEGETAIDAVHNARTATYVGVAGSTAVLVIGLWLMTRRTT